MSEPFVAEIRIWACNFAPRNWAFCNGALLPISQNTALFSLVGTTFGGDGRTTLGLPNLVGRSPMGPGNGPGLTQRRWGQVTGTETVTLDAPNLPSHSHTVQVASDAATPVPASRRFAPTEQNAYGTGATTTLSSATIGATGGGQSHTNLQPRLGVNFCIALTGTYPSRN
jgi:microcystin-dependent protein